MNARYPLKFSIKKKNITLNFPSEKFANRYSDSPDRSQYFLHASRLDPSSSKKFVPAKMFQLNLPVSERKSHRHRFCTRKHSSVASIGRQREDARASEPRSQSTRLVESDGKTKKKTDKERERERNTRLEKNERAGRAIVAGQVRKREREALVGGQRSLEFHTWINSPSSGVYSTSSSNFLSFLALVRSFPPPSRAPEAFATRIPRSTLVQPLMNVRAACDITPDTPFRYPPPPSPLPLPPPRTPTPHRYGTRYKGVHDNEAPGR